MIAALIASPSVQRCLLLASLAVSLSGNPVQAATASGVRPDLWVANGPVEASVVSDGVLYLAGTFTQLSPRTGSCVAINPLTGSVIPGFPIVSGGDVLAIVPDSLGGWFIGGAFTSVGGNARAGLAHVSADFTVSSWDPNPTGGVVKALLRNGSLLYVGGTFTALGGTQRNCLGAVNTTTGLVEPWSPNVLPAASSILTITREGPIVYVGGQFTNIGGFARNNAAAFDATTGIFTAWSPNAFQPVSVLLAHGSKVYAGGTFVTIGGQSRRHLAALDNATGDATSWNPNPAGTTVNALAAIDSTVYVGGNLGGMGGLAALDVSTGVWAPWNANTGEVFALSILGPLIYAGGDFTIAAGEPRGRLAALDRLTGEPTNWNPKANGRVSALLPAEDMVLAGGALTGAGGVDRLRLGALDLATGAATAWAPVVDGPVSDLEVLGSKIYILGEFGHVGGQPRGKAAAVDKVTGAVAGWNPNANGEMYDLATGNGVVYVGGRFTVIGGTTRNQIAALDPVTAIATAWDPLLSYTTVILKQVQAVAVTNGIVYLAGSFEGIHGTPRQYIGAADAVSGLATPWVPAIGSSGSSVTAMFPASSVVYLVGGFDSPRRDLAAVDASTGALTAFDAHVTGSSVDEVAQTSQGLHVGGDFTSIGGQPFKNYALLDPVTGSALPLPIATGPTDDVRTISTVGDDIYIGGYFKQIGGVPSSEIAGIVTGVVAVPSLPEGKPNGLELGRASPDPVLGTSMVPFALPRAARVTLTVHDVAGRRVATLVPGEFMDAGPHRVVFVARGLPNGVYFLRLEADGSSRFARVVVLR